MSDNDFYRGILKVEELKPLSNKRTLQDYLHLEFTTKHFTAFFTPLDWGIGIACGYDYNFSFNVWIGPLYICFEL